jgi:hypothetical protein
MREAFLALVVFVSGELYEQDTHYMPLLLPINTLMNTILRPMTHLVNCWTFNNNVPSYFLCTRDRVCPRLNWLVNFPNLNI